MKRKEGVEKGREIEAKGNERVGIGSEGKERR
jgi:hypothetical protein